MLLQEIQSILKNKLSPKIFRLYSEIYGLHYNSKKNNRIIKKVMLTIDLSKEAILFALKNKINLIISHHGLINKPTKIFNQPLINKLSLLSKYPISIFVLNSSFIAAEGGVSETIAKTLYLNIDAMLEIRNFNGNKVPIGRICTPKSYINEKKIMSLEDLIKRIQVNLNTSYIRYVGDLNKPIRKICIVGGDTPNLFYIKKALKKDCDCYVSGNINYINAVFSRDIGLSIIEISHYKNEIIALKKLYNVLSLEFPYVEFFLFESNDPFKFYH
ncbi:MAG: Nif3-like dinuclear metal center hexameric protein [Promethearchaeota archaeon]